MTMCMFEQVRINEAFKPATGNAASSGDWVSLKNYDGCLITVHIGQNNAATTALTVDKAKTALGGSNSNGITMNNFWYCLDAPQTSDTYTKGTAAASITSSATGTGSSIYLIDIRAEELGSDYDFIQLEAGASEATNLISATYTLYNGRYQQAAPPTAIA